MEDDEQLPIQDGEEYVEVETMEDIKTKDDGMEYEELTSYYIEDGKDNEEEQEQSIEDESLPKTFVDDDQIDEKWEPLVLENGDLQCKLCLPTVLFKTKDQFVSHRYRIHGTVSNTMLCPLDNCDLWFASLSSLKKHLILIHHEPVERHNENINDESVVEPYIPLEYSECRPLFPAKPKVVGQRPWQFLQLDLINHTPVVNSNGRFTKLLLIVDSFSKFTIAKPIPDTFDMAALLQYICDVFFTFSVPEGISSLHSSGQILSLMEGLSMVFRVDILNVFCYVPDYAPLLEMIDNQAEQELGSLEYAVVYDMRNVLANADDSGQSNQVMYLKHPAVLEKITQYALKQIHGKISISPNVSSF
uniref:Integrase catalytic domain-containing protein n=1 Tax=Rhabditophanes sp. KR3021 TaxID=114890 RepID=A0AC35UAR9_9BILA